jgi:hypothetical protein
MNHQLTILYLLLSAILVGGCAIGAYVMSGRVNRLIEKLKKKTKCQN